MRLFLSVAAVAAWAMAAIAACGESLPSPTDGAALPPRGSDAGKDGGEDAEPRACDLAVPFGAGTIVAGSATEWTDFTLHDDELEATFSMRPPLDGGGFGAYGVFHATRRTRDEPFGTPSEHVALSAGVTNGAYRAGALSSDRLTIMYFVNPPGGAFRVRVAKRPDAGDPFPAGDPKDIPDIPEPSHTHPQWITPTRVLVNAFGEGSTNRTYRATWNGTDFTAASAITEVDPYNAARAFVSGDEEVIVFTSKGLGEPPDSGALFHIYEARRMGGAEYGEPRRVTAIETPDGERTHWISRDGCRLYYKDDGANAYVMVAERK